MTSGRPKAIVVGSGFGGLALAIRLQAGGFDVTVLEKRDKPGGRAYVYEDGGFIFDGGPTVITDPTCLEELWTVSGRRMADDVTLVPVDPFYRLCWEDGFVFDYANDQAALDRQIAAIAPRDVAGYRRFLAFSEAVLEKGYVGLGAVPFLDFRSMLKVAPALVKLQSYRNVYALVARFIENEHLRQAFSFHTLLVGGNPFKTSSIYALIHALERRWGVWFPKGGTGALIAGMVQAPREPRRHDPARRGGRDDSDRERPHHGRETARGWHPARRRHGRLQRRRDAHLSRPARPRPARRAGAKRLARKRFSMSLFVVYFGLKGDHPRLAHHTVCFGPRYKRADRRDLRPGTTGGGFLALPPCAERHRSVAGAARPQRLLRALAGAPPRHSRYRLGDRGATLSRPDFRLSGSALPPEPEAGSRRVAHASRRSISATS